MAKNFRTRKFTSRVNLISQNQIERLRSTRIKNSKSSAERKFFKSSQFDKQLRSNVRTNRAKANMQTLDRIVKQIGGTKAQEKVARTIFGEKTYLKNGRKVRRNTFTSQAQTKRLQKIQMDIKKKRFSFARYLQKSQEFKEVKKFLPEGATTADIIYTLTRGEFYFENKNLIINHNKNVGKYGYYDAQTKAAGQNLRNKHYESQNKENQEFVDFIDNIK